MWEQHWLFLSLINLRITANWASYNRALCSCKIKDLQRIYFIVKIVCRYTVGLVNLRLVLALHQTLMILTRSMFGSIGTTTLWSSISSENIIDSWTILRKLMSVLVSSIKSGNAVWSKTRSLRCTPLQYIDTRCFFKLRLHVKASENKFNNLK